MKRNSLKIRAGSCLGLISTLALAVSLSTCGGAGDTAMWVRIISPGIEIDQVNLSIFDAQSSGPALTTEEIPLGRSQEYSPGATNPENQLWILIYAGEDPDQVLTMRGVGLRSGRAVCDGTTAGLRFEQGKIIEASQPLELGHAGEDKDGDGFYTPPLSAYPLEGEAWKLYDCDDNNPDIHPEANELCDGIDNNCNKSTDEGCGCSVSDSPRDCYPQWAAEPRGEPCRLGEQECVNGVWAACTGVIVPQPERCAAGDLAFECLVCGDGIDNDCDGFTDGKDPGANPDVPNDPANAEDLGCGGCFVGTFSTCYTGPAGTANVGLCRPGQAECLDGDYGECIGQVLPTTDSDGEPSEGDLCDGFDNDCDGLTDNVSIRPACALFHGVCAGSKKACSYGRWEACSEADYHENALLVICRSENPPACCDDIPPSCPGFTPEENEGIYCDGFDNDCDGLRDEVDVDGDGVSDCTCENGSTLACPEGLEDRNQGECVAGIFTCEGGVYVKDEVCVEPAVDVCDGLDNDCDGVTDGSGATGGCPESQANASWQTCSMGECIFVCLENHHDINGDLGSFGGDGCEYNCTMTDPVQERCDGLDNDCDMKTDAEELIGVSDPQIRRTLIDNLCPPRLHATVDQDGICIAPYVCVYSCNAEWGDCLDPDLDDPVPGLNQADTSDGCETALRGNPNHCGACNNACDPGEVCNGLECRCGSTGPDCAGTQSDFCCGTTCVNLLNDEDNCGDCGVVCQAQNGTNTCVNGVCVPSCNQGWGSCDHNPNNGCETNIWQTAACGANCDNRVNCSDEIEHANGAFCNQGACDYTNCQQSYGDCNLVRSDGCEQNIWTTSACGTTCNNLLNCSAEVRNADGVSCSAGSCTYTSCVAGYGDCSGGAADGCETDIWQITSCSTSCSGAVNCSTRVENATGIDCPNGYCDYDSCAPGYADCDGDPTDGCERNTWQTTACGSGCGTLPNCNTSVLNASGIICDNGTCNYAACNEHFRDCNGHRYDGCEIALGTDTHCSDCDDTCQVYGHCDNYSCVCDHLNCGGTCCASGEICHTMSNECCAPTNPCGADSCGSIVNNCGQSIDCGGCGSGETCSDNVCVCDATHEDCDGNGSCECDTSGGNLCYNNECCTPTDPCEANSCGTVSNNCGQPIACGACADSDMDCENNLCVCNHLTCNGDCCGADQVCHTESHDCCTPADPCGANSCGSIVNNCGQSIDCGGCGTGEDCVDNQCQTSCSPDCTGKECGDDGCGGSCGSCVPVTDECDTSGVCVCVAGQADCDGGVAGCETNILTDKLNCGGCGAECAGSNNCLGGICTCVNDTHCTDWAGAGWKCCSIEGQNLCVETETCP